MPIPVPPSSSSGPGVPGAVLQYRVAVLGALTMGAVDSRGTQIYLNDLEGWEGSTATTGTSEDKSGEHGSWIGDAWHPGRVVEAKLTLVGASFVAVSRSLRDIAAAIPLQTPNQLMVDDHGEVLTAKVRQGGEFKSSQQGHHAVASVVLFAPDPRRYSVAATVASTALPSTTGGLTAPFTAPFPISATSVSGVLQVTNSGNADSPPVFTITGPCTPFQLTHRTSGAVLSYPETVPAGRSVVIDMAARTALLDGAPRFVSGSWFAYSPGVNEVAFTASGYDPASLLTSTHYDAWL